MKQSPHSKHAALAAVGQVPWASGRVFVSLFVLFAFFLLHSVRLCVVTVLTRCLFKAVCVCVCVSACGFNSCVFQRDTIWHHSFRPWVCSLLHSSCTCLTSCLSPRPDIFSFVLLRLCQLYLHMPFPFLHFLPLDHDKSS